MAEEHRQRDEIDFREIARDPRRLFAYSYIYILMVLLGLGIYYAWNLSVVGKNSVTPVVIRDSSAFAKDIPLQRPRVLPPVDVERVSLPNDTLLIRGEELYAANCASCHGEGGMGDGPAGLLLNPPPRNFQVPDGWTNGQKVSEIYRTLEEGIIKNGMASYNYLPPEERFALAHYVRTFLAAAPEDSPEELLMLEATYRLSAGTSIPGQIPIKKAAAKVLLEEEATVDRVGTLATRTAQEGDTNEGAMLFNREVKDRTKVVTCFAVNTASFPDLADFVITVSADPISSGFRASVLSLSQREWSLLYQYIEKLQ
jgi:mono/diheme cytochrome c family protein